MTQLVAYDIFEEGGVFVVRTSDGAIKMSENVVDVLGFLRYHGSGILRVIWDLDDAVAPLLRALPKDVLLKLAAGEPKLYYQGHELYYLPDRMFRVGLARFYGIRQFFQRTVSQLDATLEETQDYAQQVLSGLTAIGLSDPRKLTSPVAVFDDSEWGKDFWAGMPDGYDLPDSLVQMSDKADHKEWVSNYQVGHWGAGEIFDYDLSSAYGAAACHLPDLRDMKMWQSSKRVDFDVADIGVACGKLHLDANAEYAHCSPIMTTIESTRGNMLGDLPDDCYSLDEIRFVEGHGLGTFELKEGWFGVESENKEPDQPFRELMETLYKRRQLSPMASAIAKGIIVQVVGKLVETLRSPTGGYYGSHRNEFYHMLITSGTRVRVAEFLIQNKVKADELICVQTDGVKLTRDILLVFTDMGKWRNNGTAPTIVVSPYKVYTGDKRPYSLTYDDITSMVKAHPQSQIYDKTLRRRITLIQAIRVHEDITKVGEWIDRPDTLDLVPLSSEQNRLFPKLPHTGRALLSNKYQSEPIVV